MQLWTQRQALNMASLLLPRRAVLCVLQSAEADAKSDVTVSFLDRTWTLWAVSSSFYLYLPIWRVPAFLALHPVADQRFSRTEPAMRVSSLLEEILSEFQLTVRDPFGWLVEASALPASLVRAAIALSDALPLALHYLPIRQTDLVSDLLSVPWLHLLNMVIWVRKSVFLWAPLVAFVAEQPVRDWLGDDPALEEDRPLRAIEKAQFLRWRVGGLRKVLQAIPSDRIEQAFSRFFASRFTLDFLTAAEKDYEAALKGRRQPDWRHLPPSERRRS
jgi:hypothetical protein